MNRTLRKPREHEQKKFAMKKAKLVCNICKGRYKAVTRFSRFCPHCKENSELFHFHEWLAV